MVPWYIVPWSMVQREILSFLKADKYIYSEFEYYTPSVCLYYLLLLLFGKGNLAIFERSNISETEKVLPTKIGAHACYINPYLHEFFEPIPID